MNIEDSAAVTRSERTASRSVDGRVVVVVVDTRKLHVLNDVGSRVWELADGRSVADLVDVVTREFEVDRATARADVHRFLSELVNLGAVRVGGEAS